MIQSAQISKKEIRVRMWASLVTFLVSFIVLAIKFWAFNITQSQSIYSDAVESIVNVITAIIGVIIIYYAALPVDEDHPYGHGKVEYFSAAFEGGLITLAAIFIFIEAVKAYFAGTPVHSLDQGLLLIALAGLINFAWGYILKIIGKNYASIALQSAGTHLLIDFWTTFGAIVGIGIVKFTGMIWVDRVIAILLGVHMARSGLKLVRQSASGLLDAEDVKILNRLADIFQKYAGDGVIQIHNTKVIRAGWFHHIDAHVVVPEFWSVEQAHLRIDNFENNVIRDYEYGGEANFHLDPCKRKYCSVCDYQDCQVRTKPFEARMPVELAHLRSKTEPKGTY